MKITKQILNNRIGILFSLTAIIFFPFISKAQIYLITNGNVGVGHTAPASSLHSAGQVRTGIPSGGVGGASATTGSLLFYNSTNANTVSICSGTTSTTYGMTLPPAQGAASTVLTNNGSGVLSWSSGGSAGAWSLTGNAGTSAGTNFIGTTDSIDWVVKTDNIERMRVSANGKVVGFTSSGRTVLKVGGAAADYGNGGSVIQLNYGTSPIGMLANSGSVMGDATQDFLLATPSGAAMRFGIGINYDEKMRIHTNGNVGIGTVTPASKLDVEGGISIGATYSGTTAAPSNGAIIEGKVGIGTNAPNASALLDLTSTTLGLGIMVMTTTQKNAISSPREGLLVYDTTLHKLCIRTASAWETITSL